MARIWIGEPFYVCCRNEKMLLLRVLPDDCEERWKVKGKVKEGE